MISVTVKRDNKEKKFSIEVPLQENQSLTFSLSEKEAWDLMALLFGAFMEEDIINALDRTDREISDDIVHKIAERLFDEIHSDESYWDIEDNTIFYLYDEIKEEEAE